MLLLTASLGDFSNVSWQLLSQWGEKNSKRAFGLTSSLLQGKFLQFLHRNLLYKNLQVVPF